MARDICTTDDSIIILSSPEGRCVFKKRLIHGYRVTYDINGQVEGVVVIFAYTVLVSVYKEELPKLEELFSVCYRKGELEG